MPSLSIGEYFLLRRMKIRKQRVSDRSQADAWEPEERVGLAVKYHQLIRRKF